MPAGMHGPHSLTRIRMGHLDADVVIDCFRLMDKVRRDLMYRRRWRLHDQPGVLSIGGYNQQVDLPGGNG